MKPVQIIGGGMAGMAVAYALQKRGIPYRLVEAGPRLGGKIRTEAIDGFVMEAGPDSFLTEKPEGLDLCRELGLEADFIPCNEQNRKVQLLHDGELIPFPQGCRLFIPTDEALFRETAPLSLAGLNRALDEINLPPAPPASGDESLASFVRRRFGPEVLDRIAAPILAGIYGADPERMSMAATFGRLMKLEEKHGSLMQAMAVAPKRPSVAGDRQGTESDRGDKQDHRTQQIAKNKLSSVFTSLQHGMGQITEALEAHLSGEIQLNTRVDTLPALDESDQVIIALPANHAAHILSAPAPKTSELLKQLDFASTGTVSFAFHALPDHPQGFGFMSALSDPSPLVGCTWTSNKFDHRAPTGGFLCRAFIGGQKQPELLEESDEIIVECLRQELDRLCGLRATPDFVRVARWTQGNPQYRVGHHNWVESVERQLAEEQPRVHLCGSSFRGIGLSDCVREANALVEQMFEL